MRLTIDGDKAVLDLDANEVLVNERIEVPVTVEVNRPPVPQGVAAMLIEELNISVRSYNCLKRAGYDTVEQILEADPRSLRGISGFGEKAQAEVEQIIADLRLVTLRDLAEGVVALWGLVGGECEHGHGEATTCPDPDCNVNDVRGIVRAAQEILR